MGVSGIACNPRSGRIHQHPPDSFPPATIPPPDFKSNHPAAYQGVAVVYHWLFFLSRPGLSFSGNSVYSEIYSLSRQPDLQRFSCYRVIFDIFGTWKRIFSCQHIAESFSPKNFADCRRRNPEFFRHICRLFTASSHYVRGMGHSLKNYNNHSCDCATRFLYGSSLSFRDESAESGGF